jgi:CRP-like cAMP-binding protein
MEPSCLADNLGRFCSLTAAEGAVLAGLEGPRRTIRRGTVIRTEHAAMAEMFVLTDGWLACSMVLEDGRRQIIRLHFRGDLLGADMLAFARAPDAVTALTDAEIRPIDPMAFGQLFASHPRLAALFYLSLQAERVVLTNRLTSLGRASAKGRLAALLLWIVERLREADPGVRNHVILPLTQEEIGDATGLTAVHVNRTLRVMEEQGLIERSRNQLMIVDPARLAAIANHQPRDQRTLPGWLPVPTREKSDHAPSR